jgi:hypothetical protein
MKWKKVMILTVTILTCLFIFSVPRGISAGLYAEPIPTLESQTEISDQVEQAILDAIAINSSYIQGGMVTNLQVNDIAISQDQLWATAWVTYYDSQIEAILPTEPALAVMHKVNNEWQVFLPTDQGWEDSIYSIPEDLLSKEEKDMWVAMNQGVSESFPTQTGYMLPWHGGQTAYLSRSVGHDADFTTAHFAFDFYVPGGTVCPSGGMLSSGTTGLNFDIYASRAATVWGWEDSVADCDHSNVNFIVLRNVDDPSLFQLYLHLAQNSIPSELKSVGKPVSRGQFIGRADNTGASTGSHLHFQVEHQPNWPTDNPYWSTALDVTFDDVDINGGRPRVSPLDPPYCKNDDVCDVFRQTYTSNNYYQDDFIPPIGELAGVSTGDIVISETLTLSGWGSDSESGLDYGQLIAYFNGDWHNLGTPFNPDFTYTWDLCAPELSVEDGAVSIAMLLYDNAGNPAPLVGLRHFIKNYTCPSPPPTCIPSQDQVTLFEDPYFQGGCVVFNIGNYPTGNSLNPIGNDDADSLLIGDNVLATFYSEENFVGHSQSFGADTGFMRYKWVADNTLSSMKVTSRSTIPLAPVLVSPMESTAFREGDVIPLSWFNGGGAVDFQIEIYKDTVLLRTIPWQSDPVVYVDSLGQGNYSWRVQGRNAGGVSNWSQKSTFSIESPIVIPPEWTVPYSDTMEDSQGRWTRNGFWSYISNPSMAHSGSRSWWYQNTYGNYSNGNPNIGSLTSPPIAISSFGYYLRFYYRYQTETQGLTWDQRWVQISVDAQPFMNLAQLYDDPQMPETSSWLRIKAIDLSGYAGHIIRIRFQFSTLDAFGNNFSGWGIDDFSITAEPPATCDDARDDDSAAQAFLLTYDPNITLPGQICPNGDYDYYKFYGDAGDRIVVDIDAMIDGSLLDSYLFLLDHDGQTILAENDDEVYAQKRDPLLTYTLTDDGEYYLKIRAWKHPLAGGNDLFYSIRLYEDHIDPVASITWPDSNSYLPDADMTVNADVSDVNKGVNRVEFYWHSSNWLPGTWEFLGTDYNGSDGWKIAFNPTGQPEGNNAAFSIKAFDLAGNLSSIGAWNLGIDKTAPVTEMKPLSATQPSNAFLLEWTAIDNLSGLDFVEIQEKMNNAIWLTLPTVDEIYENYWIIAIPGNSYSYRMHGVDHSGNSENYPSTAETSTTIPNASVICFAPDSFDTSGNDNSPVNASVINVNGATQIHNYCNPLSPDYQNDEDWIRFDAATAQHYLVVSTANSPQTATIISLYAQDGITLLAESVPQKFGENTALVWTSDRNESVFIRLTHLDGRVIGKDVATTVFVHAGEWTFLPMINRTK